MSLHAILEAIRLAGSEKVQEIEAVARSQTYEILANARLEAEEIHKEACAKASAPAARERAQILHRSRLEALQIVGSVREAMIDIALERVRGCLISIRADPAYPEVLRQLTLQTLDEIRTSQENNGTTLLKVDPRDQRLIEQIIQEQGLDLKVRCELNTWGGLIAESDDERIVVINTLESRLERAAPFLRHILAARFEAELDTCQTEDLKQRAAFYV